MRKIFFLVAFLSASIMSFAQDVNFALASNGSSATASTGTAGNAIDGNQGTRWESTANDDEWFLLDMGQSRTFNAVNINWEGAYARKFQLLASADGENFTVFHNETNLDHAGWQKLYFETAVTARYIKYQGIERATGYGQSFFEFEVYYQSEAPKTYTQINGVTIAASSGGYNDANRVLDGNAGTEWQGSPTNGTAPDEAARTFDAWFVVDLGGLYDVDKVDIHFEGACAQEYHIDFSEDNTTWKLGYNFVGNPGINGRTDEVTELTNNTKVRYVRFWSTKAGTEWGMKIFEFRVYGAEWVPASDTEKPVMVSATVVSKTFKSVVIAVAATDDNGIAKYRVVESSKSIDAQFVPTDGEITITGLSENTAYNFNIYAIDVVGKESDAPIAVAVTTNAFVAEPQEACAAPTWPAGQVQAIYSPTYNADCGFQDWGSGTTALDTEYGKKFILVGGGYFGLDGFALNCLLMEKLHVDIWIADDATLRLVPIYGGAGLKTDDTHGKFVNLVGGQWNSIDLDLAADYAGLNLASIFQFKIDNAANLTFWLGNLYFYRAEALDDDEAPTNLVAGVTALSYFSVTLAVSANDNSGVVNYRVLNGEEEVAHSGGMSGATVNITVSNLQANTEYNFYVIAEDANGNAAEPIAVQATTMTAPAPAEAPTYEADKVQGVFTDIYTDLSISIQDWYAGPAIAIGALSESSQAICLTPNATPSSCFGLAFAPTDISGYTAMEMDVYPTAEDAKLNIQVIGDNAGLPAATVYTLVANQWNHISLNIAGNTKNNCEQIGFYDCNNLQSVTFVQNVLFVDKDNQGIDNVQGDKVQCTKVIENGVLYLMRNGAKYNVQGVRVQ